MQEIIAKTIRIPLTCEFITFKESTPLGCTFQIDNGKIIVFPNSTDLSIIDAYITDDNEDTPLSESYSLVANLELVETDNADYTINVNEDLGYVYIKPDAQFDDVEGFANFVSVMTEDEARLQLEAKEEDSEEEPSFENIEAEVLNEGTMQVPFTVEQARKLKTLMDRPISKKDALNVLKDLLVDDQLSDSLSSFEDDTDVRDLIQERLRAILDNYNKDNSEPFTPADLLAEDGDAEKYCCYGLHCPENGCGGRAYVLYRFGGANE
jgi:hypothetical protein